MSDQPISLRRKVRRFIGNTWLRAFGWEVEGGVPDVKKAVVVAAPHTSNWDFPFSLAIAFALDVDIAWLGKHTIFDPPFGALARWVGGIAVDRRARHDLVTQVVTILKDRDDVLLLVPPEGTRSRAARWKTGFYYIATGAQVPIILGFLDFERRRGGLGKVFYPSGDIDADMVAIQAFYKGIKGKHPERMGSVTLGDRPETKRGAAVVGLA